MSHGCTVCRTKCQKEKQLNETFFFKIKANIGSLTGLDGKLKENWE